MLNARQRFRQTMTFGDPQGVFFWCRSGALRQATLHRWFQEGLPAELGSSDSKEAWRESWRKVRDYLGFDRSEDLPVDYGPLPRFEERILEQDERYQIWIDELGAKRLDFREQPEPGFQTRTWIEFPVKTRHDYLRIIERHDAGHPERYPSDWSQYAASIKDRDYPVRLVIPSMFSKVRDWMGLEAMSVCMYDDPGLMHEMMEFVADFVIEATRRALADVEVDWVMLHEDMAYKTASMISPAMVRRFMLPGYRRIVSFIRDAGVPVVSMDSDGNINELIPIWLEAGIDSVFPLEIAAGMDPVALRERYGQRLGLIGGIDKRELARDKAAVEREVLAKVPQLLRSGGYIPNVDHGVPTDVPYENFRYFVQLVREVEAEVFGSKGGGAGLAAAAPSRESTRRP
ncbi:MAG: hypothetical protein HPY83_13350 [Anaerolineae bacterium]|nr:hypothetical protein [Anaerolineae bacterium]